MTKKKIKHREPSETTKKQILAASGNQCAFPACDRIIVDREHNVLVGKIAHIKARSEDGPRFDSAQSEEDNRSANNLLALCSEHHDIVDARHDIYTVDKLLAMKREHEEQVENSADRLWIRYPNFVSTPINGVTLQAHWWVDRSGRPRIYSERQLATAQTLMRLYLDINKLCTLQETVQTNPKATCEALAQQDYAMLDKGKWTAIAHILRLMGQTPDITFGEFIRYLVQDGDPTGMLVDVAKEFEEKVQSAESVKVTK